MQYASFLSLVPDYHPTLLDRAALPPRAELPAAPSRVWPDFGVAMLRSEESPAYWTSSGSIAVLQRMIELWPRTRGRIRHYTARCWSATLSPDYNFIQYENPALGWTRNTIAHSTVVVDGQESKSVEPSAVRHDFSTDVKFLATSASGVFPRCGPDTRANADPRVPFGLFSRGERSPAHLRLPAAQLR